MKKINLNKASVDDLTKIEGVGKETAKKVVDYREKKHGIKDFDELRNIRDIDDKMRDKLRSGTILE